MLCPVKHFSEFFTISKFILISNYFTSNHSTCENIFFEEVFPINYKTFIYPRYDIEQQIMFKGNSFSVTLVWDIMGYFQLLLV